MLANGIERSDWPSTYSSTIVIPRLQRPRSASLFNSGRACSSFHTSSQLFGPVLAENAATNLLGLEHLSQTLLHRDPNIPTNSLGSISMNDLEHKALLLVR